jgi:hypothetical protein
MSNDLEMGMWDREYPSEQELRDKQEAIENGISYDYDEEFYEDFIEEYDDDEEEIDTVNEAHVRLEQGRLYNMLINHNLFEGVDADPTAIANVQKQLKDFILEKLEEMLGMRAKKEAQPVTIQSDFSKLEIQVLKKVASKMSKGMTDSTSNSEPVKNELNTVKKQEPTKRLNSLGGQKKQATKNVKKQTKKIKKKRPVQQVSKPDVDIQKSDNEEIGFMDRFKGKSLEEANEIVAQRHRRPVPKTNINQDAVNSYYSQKVAMQDTKMSDFGRIMKMAALQKAQQKG